MGRFFATQIGGFGAGSAVGIKFSGHPLQPIVLPIFLQNKLSLLVPVAGQALFFALDVGDFGFFGT